MRQENKELHSWEWREENNCPKSYDDCEKCYGIKKDCRYLRSKEKKPQIPEKDTMQTWDSWYDVEQQRTEEYKG